jgi:hypothetical protein
LVPDEPHVVNDAGCHRGSSSIVWIRHILPLPFPGHVAISCVRHGMLAIHLPWHAPDGESQDVGDDRVGQGGIGSQHVGGRRAATPGLPDGAA